MFAGRYEIGETIGAGASSTVYRAIRISDRAEVAIKVLHSWLEADKEAAERLFREARAIAELRHPNCVRMLDWGIEDARPFVVLELLRGESLAQTLEREGRFDVERVIRIGVQLCDVLHAAHEMGIVHRDLKPQNIMESDGIIKVLDFGVARLMPGMRSKDDTLPKRLTLPGAMLGTPTHMAPEVMRGAKGDPRSDMYSLGVVLYELLSGVLPIEGATLAATMIMIVEVPPRPLSETAPHVDETLAGAVMSCLDKEPKGRWKALELRAVLVAMLVQETVAELARTVKLKPT